MLKQLKFYLILALLSFFIACSEDEEDASAPTGTVPATLDVQAGGSVNLSATFEDAQGLASVTVSSTDLTLNDVTNLDGEGSFQLLLELQVPREVPAGSYGITVTAENIVGLTTDFNISLNVSEAVCPADSFDGATASGSSNFTDSNDDYPFDDYSADFTSVAIEVNDDCSVLTITGDFLDWNNTIDENYTPVLNLTIDPSDNSLSFVEEIIGEAPDTFTYRMASSGTDGSFDPATGTMTISLYIEYLVGEDWVYWYTTTSSFTLD